MRYIAIVAESFALIENDKVIGVVTPSGKDQWSFHPIVEGTSGLFNYISLHHALQEALKFEPTNSA